MNRLKRFKPLTCFFLRILGVLCIFLASTGWLRAQANPASQQQIGYDEIDAYVQNEMKTASIPGLAYAIVKGDQVVHMQEFGTADSTGRPVTSQTPFLIGSVGKTITSLAIQQLVSAGQVELDAPVQRYIPWFLLADAEVSKVITIRHLLTHTSGLSTGDGANLKYIQTDQFTNQEIVRSLGNIQLDRPVGSSQEYSNLNFLILGQVIEQVSGQTYEEYIQKHIFEPLEMQQTYMDLAEAHQAGLAQGHRILFGFLAPLQLPYPRGLMSTGYHISTIEDMSHLLIAHLNQGRYGDISIFNQNGKPIHTINSGTSYYDIHWLKLESITQGFTDAQSGTSLDYSACYYIMPYYHTGVVVLTNANTAEAIPAKNAMTIAFDILEMTTGYTGRSAALSAKMIYIGIDLFLLGMLALPAVQVLSLRRWKKSLSGRQKNAWISFLPSFLIDFAIPLILLVGIPFLIPPALVPGLSFRDAWPFFIYTMPDISYPLLGIAGLMLVIGFIKLFWFLRHRRDGINGDNL